MRHRAECAERSRAGHRLWSARTAHARVGCGPRVRAHSTSRRARGGRRPMDLRERGTGSPCDQLPASVQSRRHGGIKSTRNGPARPGLPSSASPMTRSWHGSAWRDVAAGDVRGPGPTNRGRHRDTCKRRRRHLGGAGLTSRPPGRQYRHGRSPARRHSRRQPQHDPRLVRRGGVSPRLRGDAYHAAEQSAVGGEVAACGRLRS